MSIPPSRACGHPNADGRTRCAVLIAATRADCGRHTTGLAAPVVVGAYSRGGRSAFAAQFAAAVSVAGAGEDLEQRAALLRLPHTREDAQVLRDALAAQIADLDETSYETPQGTVTVWCGNAWEQAGRLDVALVAKARGRWYRVEGESNPHTGDHLSDGFSVLDRGGRPVPFTNTSAWNLTWQARAAWWEPALAHAHALAYAHDVARSLCAKPPSYWDEETDDGPLSYQIRAALTALAPHTLRDEEARTVALKLAQNWAGDPEDLPFAVAAVTGTD